MFRVTEPCTARAPRPDLTRLWVVLVLSGLTLVAELVGAWVSGSLALLADAGHLLTDVGAIGLTLLTSWLATRPPSPERSYGHLRWEILGALINGASLLALSVWIIVEAAGRLGEPQPVRGGVLLLVAVGGLVANLIALALLHRDRHGSLNLRGAYLHVLGDLLGSVGAIAAGVIIWRTGWMAADSVISIALAILIVVGAWRLVRESAAVLLEEAPRHLPPEKVEQAMRGVRGVTAVHDLHVWTVTSGMVAMSGHAVVPALNDHPRALGALQAAVRGVGIAHATIQLEVEGPCPEPEPTHHHGATGHHHGHSHS
jgi:cobalt-zinc-cadmium efflux system protein